VLATQKSVNALVVDIDAARVDEVAALPGVTAVAPMVDPEVDLSATVPYIGAAALHARTPGITGKGVRIAVLDTGIDYTHARLGGAGTPEAYAAAYGTSVTDPRTTTTDGLFPTAKVIGGFDFIGEAWAGGTNPLVPDPDPIDCGPSAIPLPCAGGHGTHVSSIVAGNNGVAPDAKLYAYKVCSSVSTSCSGVALLQAMEAVLDPDGDGDVSDAVDLVNMSLGANYGQRENPLSAASAHAVRMGVVVVASAGNGGDKPYIAGSPSTAREVLSVAETQVPGAKAFVLKAGTPPVTYKNTNVVDWAPITTGFAGDVKYGTTPDERLGCVAYPAGFFTGAVALIDRGTCAVSIKVDNAARAGATGVLVANNAPGAAPSFSFGGPPTFTPAQTLVVGQEVGAAIKAGLAAGPVPVSVDPADATPLVGSMVATSSRGPSVAGQAIKPEIGAPGASVSANAGGGTTESAFGGTSGAAPMVTGSAALLLQAHPNRSPIEVKSALMNTAETDIRINPSTLPGRLAEISRIGAGEVRADRAVDTRTAAWEKESFSAALSFGYQAVDDQRTLVKHVKVRNYSDSWRAYQVSTSFRYADDAAGGAVRVSAPPRILVAPRDTAGFDVTLRIDARKLPDWGLDGGPNGANGSLLAANEFDGYVTLSGGGDRVHLPWHVLPHRAADVDSDGDVRLRDGAGSLTLRNKVHSGQTGTAEVFALTGTSDRIPRRDLPADGDNRAVIDLRAVGVRSDADVVQFGVTTFGQRAHPDVPGRFEVLIDTNRDGTDDFMVFNGDATLAATGQFDGRNVVFAQPVGATTAAAAFFIDADLDSANAILTVPLAAVGLKAGAQFDFHVQARDTYFSGAVTDTIATMTFTLGTPRFAASAATVPVPAGGSAKVGVTAVAGGDAASPSQRGLLLLERDQKVGDEADLVRVF
jgi:subtilisin family serine protease